MRYVRKKFVKSKITISMQSNILKKNRVIKVTVTLEIMKLLEIIVPIFN